jgi:hypothetical protein
LNDSAATQTQLYIRLLFSAECARQTAKALQTGALPPRVAGWVRALDFGRLDLERAARLRNLSFYLTRAVDTLRALLAPSDWDALVSSYCDSDQFWQQRGRNLAENFCLYAHDVLHARGQGFLASVARLDGVTSGLHAGGTSPWPGVHQGGPSETLVSAWPLLDDQGSLPGPQNIARLERRGDKPFEVTVTLLADGRVKTECTEAGAVA